MKGIITPEIYLGSILLEPNRWKPDQAPSIRVSEWSDRAAAAGFAGWELWEKHYLTAPKSEQLPVRHGAMPVKIFNTYARFDHNGSADRNRAIEALHELPRLTGMKFNVGNEPTATSGYRACIQSTRTLLPAATSLLCECHPDTQLETPAMLADFIDRENHWPFEIIILPFLDGPELIRKWFAVAGRHVTHAHVQMRDPKNPRVFVGLVDDRPRAKECLAALVDGGFRGTFTLEFSAPTLTTNDEPEALFRAARLDFDFLRENWP